MINASRVSNVFWPNWQQSLIGCVILISTVAFHANAQIPPPTSPIVPEGRAVGMTPEIKSILQTMLAKYRELKSYQDSGEVAVRQSSGRIHRTTQMPSSIIFQRPNLMQVVGGAQLISCDGKTLQIVLDGLRQYTSIPAPAKLTMEHIKYGAPGGGIDEGYPEIVEFLLGEDVYQRWIRRIKTIEKLEPTKVGDRMVHVIQFETVFRARVAMYIDQETSLLSNCYFDATRAQDSPNAPPRPPDQRQTIEIQYRLSPIQHNQKLADSSFVVVPPKRMQLVKEFRPSNMSPETESFEPQSIDPPQNALVGTKMPKIQGKDLDNQQVDSKNFEGKVTLLFFWSPNAGLDCLSAIQIVQRLADRFQKEDSVNILAISGQADQPDVIRELMKLKKSNFQTVLDVDNLLMRSYKIDSLPAFFVVSNQGIIRHAAVGAPTEQESLLTKQIEQELQKTK